jgi:hypothetical protein
MLFDVHHFSYFTSRFDIILLSLVPDTRYFAWFIIYLDSLLVIFMISIADLSAARSQEPKFMLHKFIGRKKIFFFLRNNTGFPFFCIAIIFLLLFP